MADIQYDTETKVSSTVPPKKRRKVKKNICSVIVTICGLITVFLLCGGILFLDFSSGLSPYVGGVSMAGVLDNPISTMTPILDHEDAYVFVDITFAGANTTGSMMGSSAFGTFNQLFAEAGAGYFYSRLSERLLTDDFTVSSCNVVFSDRSGLAPIAKDSREWYRSASITASVFPDGGIDVLGVTGERCHDYGDVGYTDTLDSLSALGVAYAESGNVYVHEFLSDTTLAVYFTVGSAEDKNAIAWLDDNAEKHGIVAVYVTDNSGSTELSEEKKAVFRKYADHGADIVIGTNTVNLLPIEEYNESVLVYSLGSLIDGAARYPEKYTALFGVRAKVSGGKVQDMTYEVIPCGTYDDKHSWCPYILEDGTEKESVIAYMMGNTAEP